jgi:hypothetical protein
MVTVWEAALAEAKVVGSSQSGSHEDDDGVAAGSTGHMTEASRAVVVGHVESSNVLNQ